MKESMARKTAQVQIRLSPAQKRQIERQARQAGRSLSAWILESLLPGSGGRFEVLCAALADATSNRERLILAEIHDHLESMAPGDLESSLPRPEARLSAYRANLLAAMVEFAARRKGVSPPAWVAEIAPLERPVFATKLASLRLHLLLHAPVEFRRRNLFVDATVGDRV